MEHGSIPLEHPVWTVLRACWDVEPSQRPTMADILRSVRHWQMLLCYTDNCGLQLRDVTDSQGIAWPPEE